MGKDRAKGRGGGGRGAGKKMFIANEDELAIREQEIAEQREQRARRRGDEEDGDDSGAEEGAAPASGDTAPKDTVFGFGKAAATAAAAEGEEEQEGASAPANPNRAVRPAGDGMNRREREALAAQKAKEDYMRRHLAGETEQARKDLERLAMVRKRREEAAKKREAEGRPPGWTATGVESGDSDSDGSDDAPVSRAAPATAPAAPAPAPAAPAPSAAAAKKKAAAAAVEEETAEAAADGGPPKLKAMDIKQMNGDTLKEHLKVRGLNIQGQKKDLMKRLLDYEAARP